MQSDPYLVFGHWILIHFNILHMKPHWDPYISGNEPDRALKTKMPKEMFVKNLNLKVYWDIFYTAWVTPMQTLEKNTQKQPFLHFWMATTEVKCNKDW